MKLALIKEITAYDKYINLNNYESKLKKVMDKYPDIIMGPEFSFANKVNPMNYYELLAFVERISNNIDDGQLIIPGAGLILSEKNKSIRDIAPIITKYRYFFVHKTTSAKENEIAKEFKVNYKKGANIEEGIFSYKNNLVALEICRDHIIGVLKDSTDIKLDLELITGCGILEGPHFDNAIIKDGGIYAVNDGANVRDKKHVKRGVPWVCVYRRENGNFNYLGGEETQDYFITDI